ncbi:hypothetical protein SLEP1_g59012 [Rubroshorea leprosula]|uniref:Uncharacterized protein n=1 Tax=Rubroshorea leprosula TaxID=152421 RepID=A0AAV5MRI3_9ROSI|nr:hypothetical protein SLEP1_g59012 [Rubroshorea leprosula]
MATQELRREFAEFQKKHDANIANSDLKMTSIDKGGNVPRSPWGSAGIPATGMG